MANNSTTMLLPESECVAHFKDVLLFTLYALLILIGVTGNACICYIFGYRNNQIKTVTEILILYLAVFDFLASIFGPFIFMYWIITCSKRWHFGYIGCKILPLLSRIFVNISLGIILILAVDRYRAICSPFKGQFKKKYIHFAVFITIILSLVCELQYIAALHLGTNQCLVVPDNKVVYRKVSLAILFIRDLTFICVFSLTTSHITWTLKKRDSYTTSSSCVNLNRQETNHIVRLVIVMQLVFLMLVLPRDILHIVYNVSWLDNDGIPFSSEIINLNEFLKVFQTANCCANIFIYSKLHDRFRCHILEVVNNSINCNDPESPDFTPPNVIIRSRRQLLSVKLNNRDNEIINADYHSVRRLTNDVQEK